MRESQRETERHEENRVEIKSKRAEESERERARERERMLFGWSLMMPLKILEEGLSFWR